MTTNFQFLKKINNNLYEIIAEAEKLYRDEYFDQCITQTRRFAEQICKDMLEQHNKETGSFDNMIETLKDNSNGHVQEKEFIDDLYFLKKNGNNAVHSGSVKKNAILALECLQRAFELAINYCVYNKGASSEILKYAYDTELLITNKKSQSSLTEKYEKAKRAVKVDYSKEEEKKYKTNKQKTQKTSNPIKKDNKEKTQLKKEQKGKIKISPFWKFIMTLSSISVIGIIYITLSVIIKTNP